MKPDLVGNPVRIQMPIYTVAVAGKMACSGGGSTVVRNFILGGDAGGK
jgi:hypothetical protein